MTATKELARTHARCRRPQIPATTTSPCPSEIRKRSLALFDRTFAVTYLLEAVAVLIGLFGISASMSSQVLARRGEFGMLRHLGVTRFGEIGRMLAFEGAALGTIGVAAGLVRRRGS